MKYLMSDKKLTALNAFLFDNGYNLGQESADLEEEAITKKRQEILDYVFDIFTIGSDEYFAKHLPAKQAEGNEDDIHS